MRGTMLELFHERVRTLGERAALRRKRGGVWQPVSWREYGALVGRLARGLVALGHQKGDAVGILSFNRVEWVVSYVGTQTAGGVPVGIYTTSSSEQVQYILHHCEAPVVVVENAAQLEKVRAVKAQLPHLRWAVVLDALTGPREDWVVAYDELLAKGDAVAESALPERLDALEPGGLATLIYTSGTTGPPKAVMLSHHNLRWVAEQSTSVIGDAAKDAVVLSYLPLAHIAEQQFSIHQAIMHGIEVWFAESLEPLTLRANIAEARPKCFFGVPRIWEKFKAGIEAKVKAAPPLRQKLFAAARAAGHAYYLAQVEQREPSLAVKLQHALFERLVFSKLKAALGFDRCLLFISGAAPIGRDVLDFWLSLGIVIREVYGQSEDTGPTAFNTPERTKLGTVGPAYPGVDVRIAPDGEVLVRGPHVFLGYYKDPAATAETLEDGWLHSGDVGELDADGFLRITDRKKDLLVTSGGKKAAPQNLEALLKAIPPVSQAIVVGDKRNYLAAVLTLEPAAAAEWAKQRGLPTDVATLAEHPALRDELQQGIDRINGQLAKWETLKRFVVIERDFTVETGELTPTMKLKRKVVAEKYRDVIEGLYAGEAATGT